MALLKDLIVQGASRFVGDTYLNNIKSGTFYGNLAGGAKGSIPYQSAADTTTLLGIGSEGLVLKVGSGGVPEWGSNSDSDTKYKLTLNGTINGDSSGTSLGTLYAPTTAGTSGQILKSNGSGAPSWENLTLDEVTDGSSRKLSDYILKVSNATNNHLAALDANGSLKDSGKASEDFALSSVYSTRSSNTVAVINVPVEEGAFSNGTAHTLTVVVLTTEQKAAVKSVTGIEFNYCDTSQSFTTPENIYSDSGLTTHVARILVCKNSSIDGLSGSFFNASAELTAGTYYGRRVRQSGTRSHTEGNSCIASGNNSHSEGNQATSTGTNSHSEGQAVIASGICSHTEGYNTIASGNCSHSEGNGTTASGTNSHTEGYNTIASGSHSHTEGYNTTASGNCSHTEGSGTTASNNYSHAEGRNTTASGQRSHAEGEGTTASGSYSHAEGYNTKTFSNDAHAEGISNIAFGIAAHVEGSNNTTGDDSAHAEGNNVAALGDSSHAEGAGTCLSVTAAKSGNVFTLAEGTWGDVIPSAGDVVAWEHNSTTFRWSKVVSATSNSVTLEDAGSGSGNKNIKVYMHAAVGDKSHVSGWNNIALQNYQTVIGTNALKDTNNDYAFIVGNGANAGARGNAFAVGWDGKLYRFNGSTPVEVGTSGTSAYWFTGTAVQGIGTGISATVSGSKAGDMYLNIASCNVYIATAANTWNYRCNIKGQPGLTLSYAHRFEGTPLEFNSTLISSINSNTSVLIYLSIEKADSHITILQLDGLANVHLTYHCIIQDVNWYYFISDAGLTPFCPVWCGNVIGTLNSPDVTIEISDLDVYGTLTVAHNQPYYASSSNPEELCHAVLDLHFAINADTDFDHLFLNGHYFELTLR